MKVKKVQIVVYNHCSVMFKLGDMSFVLFCVVGKDVLEDCSLYLIIAHDCWSLHDEVS